METNILKEMIAVIEAEERRRASLQADQDPDIAYYQRFFIDLPFINELYLMMLVTLNHQIERELVDFAARAADFIKEISGQEYQEKVKQLQRQRKGVIIGWDWKTINNRLELDSCEGYTCIKALRLLANSYKHDPYKEPDRELLEWLNAETGINYAPLPESDLLQEVLAAFIGLEKGASYCDIAKRFVDIANDFLVNVQSKLKLSEVKWGPLSFNPKDYAH